jgi:CheY-like chemotaxis protein
MLVTTTPPSGMSKRAGAGDDDARPPRADAIPARTVLVVDDDADHSAAIRDILEDEGYRVRAAVNGLEALQALLSGALPDLILLDMMMPVMDGWTFAAELKSRPALAAIPVVAISVGGDPVLYRAPVCAGYLSKPFGAWRLVETVARCLAREPTPRGGWRGG